MKLSHFILTGVLASALTACMTDSHHYTQNAQKIVSAVNTKYPADKKTLVFIDAPEGYIAQYVDNAAVENSVDTGKVAAIISSLALKTSTVIVAGEDEKLAATTLAKALSTGKDKINGSKAIVIGAKGSQKTLTDLATASGVALEFIDNPI
ncbi:MAG: hypothetical protein H7Z20_05735 [Bdellovibrio sp.]|nr:hypothetical protein [Methylotenera sp.]